MLDISWGELLLIGVVALIVIGPKELPTVLRTVGQWMGKMRRMASEFQGQFQEAMREAEMADLKKSFDETTSSLQTSLDPVGGLKSDIEKLIEDPLAAAQTPENVATSNPTASATPADPVALGTAPATPAADPAPAPAPTPAAPADPVALGTAPAAPTPEPAAPAIATPAPAEGGKAA